MKTQKNAKYCCEKCQFVSDNKYDYGRHIITLKHVNETNETKMKQQKTHMKIKCECNEVFNSRTTLWRHKKNCTGVNDIESKNESNVIQNNEELIKCKEKDEMIIDLQKQLIEALNKPSTVNNNTQNNNQFNLQMYLNETCSNAMNIDTFLKNINVTLENVVEIGEIGYSKGIGNLIAKHIKGMKQTDKPIQTTDVKRGLSWIKNKNNEWVKDENLALGNNLIFLVGDKYFRKYNDGYKTIAEWRDGQSKIHDKVIKSIGEIASVVSTDDKSGYYSKIHKTIAESTVIKK